VDEFGVFAELGQFAGNAVVEQMMPPPA
jgi:hypothetical protein